MSRVIVRARAGARRSRARLLAVRSLLAGARRRLLGRFELGRRGERVAAAAARRRGLEVLGRNVRVGRDELDLVAFDSRSAGGAGRLVFVEVKSFTARSRRQGLEKIDERKKRSLLRACRRYAARVPRARSFRRAEKLMWREGTPAWRLDAVLVRFVPRVVFGRRLGWRVDRLVWHERIFQPDVAPADGAPADGAPADGAPTDGKSVDRAPAKQGVGAKSLPSLLR